MNRRRTGLPRARPPGADGRRVLPLTNTRPAELAPMENIHDTAFERCERIEPVAILYGGKRLYVSEFNSSRRLLKELRRLGRQKIRVRGMISGRGALDRSSLRALNCYLEFTQWHGINGRAWGLHRFAWHDLQREVALRWVS